MKPTKKYIPQAGDVCEYVASSGIKYQVLITANELVRFFDSEKRVRVFCFLYDNFNAGYTCKKNNLTLIHRPK